MKLRALICALLLALATAVPRPALALDRDFKSVLVGGGYGLLGGTVLGLASYPLTRDARSIFIGSAVGLYLGIIVGIYNVVDRDNPENPLKANLSPLDTGPQPSNPTSGLDLAPAPSRPDRPDLAAAAPSALKEGQKSGPPAILDLKIPVARF
jgi:hypothetical protein